MNQNRSHIEEHLLLQYLLGNSADDERAAVEAWLCESEANRALLDKLEELWLETGRLDPPPLAVDIDAGWMKLSDRIASHDAALPIAESRRGSSRFMRYAIGVAAAIILLFGVYALIRIIAGQSKDIEMVALASIVHDTLPDGSRITLNLQSKLTCPEKFEKQNRIVRLTGEALFEVKKDSARPFIIMAGEAGIRVLGTTFTVKAYPGKDVEVAVTEGRVQFFRVDSHTGDTLSILLGAGESGVLKPGAMIPESMTERAPDDLFWANRTLEFNGTPLSAVFAVIEKYYPVKISVSQPSILDCRLSASFANEDPSKILAVIAESFGLKLIPEGQTFHLTGKGCGNEGN